MKIEEMFDDIFEASIRGKHGIAMGELGKIQKASLVYCRYNNGSVYLIKNRDGERGYVSEQGLQSRIFARIKKEVGKYWRCNEMISIVLMNERRIE